MDKIYHSAGEQITGRINLEKTPMDTKELLPDPEANPTQRQIRHYQQKVGSLLYAAVISRPDIAFATFRLARFNSCLGDQHHKAADRVLRYLYRTRHHVIKYLADKGDRYFVCASDAAFADNSLDRRSF